MIQSIRSIFERIWIVNGIQRLADGIAKEFQRLLPHQRKTQCQNLSLLVATMLDVRSANLMDLAAGLPRATERIDMRYQWIARVLMNRLIDPDVVMAPFAREVLSRLAAQGHPLVVLMLAVRYGERALPVLWRVVATGGAIGFAMQREVLNAAVPLLPEGAEVCLMADRFYGTAELILLCQQRQWDYRLRLKGNLVVRDAQGRTKTGQLAEARLFALEKVRLTAKPATTNIGVIHDPEHAEPWIIALAAKPGYLKTLDYSARWAIEPMFSDFKSRGFGVEDTQIQHPDRLARLLLIMALALYTAVSTGQWDAATNPTPTEKNT